MTKKNLSPLWLDRTIYPFQNRSLDLEWNTVHYVDEGQGPVLLLLHGNATYSFLYRHIIRTLSGRFRCIALDYPGFGLSTARDGYGYWQSDGLLAVGRKSRPRPAPPRTPIGRFL